MHTDFPELGVDNDGTIARITLRRPPLNILDLEMIREHISPAPEKRDRATKRPLFEPSIVREAVVDSFRKLDPRVQARNPVMLVVLVGSILTTVLFLRDIGRSTAAENVFSGLTAAFLWITPCLAAMTIFRAAAVRAAAACAASAAWRTCSGVAL